MKNTTPFQDVKAFHKKYKLEGPGTPQLRRSDLMLFRMMLLKEEVCELFEAVEKKDLTAIADALIDIEYVVHGFSVTLGLPHDKLWNEVHKTNMKKVRAKRAGDSKRKSTYDVVKPDGWVKPNLVQFL